VLIEARLRESKGSEASVWFRALFRHSPIGLFVADLDGTVLIANASARALGGWEELRGRVPLVRFIAAEQRKVLESYLQMVRAGGTIDFETALLCADQTPLPVAATLYPLRRANKLMAIGGRLQDLTLSRLSEQWLIETEQRFRSLFDYHPDGVALVDAGGAIVLANRAISEMTGRPLEELALRQLDALFTADQADALRTKIAHTIAGATTEFDSRIVDRDGAEKEVLIKTVPVYVEAKVTGAYLIAKDVSAQKDAERDAREQSERIRSLYVVAASAGRSTAEQIQATLEVGKKLLDCNFAFIVEKEGNETIVRYRAGSGARGIGDRRSLSESYVRHILAQRDVLSIENLAVDPWASDPARRRLERTALIGTPIDVFGKVYGAVAFATDREGGRRFRDSDADLVRLIGALCGSAIERLTHEDRLGALAFYDALTGLPNRVLFDDRVTQTFVAARRHRQKFAILYVDLDHFKEVNDTYGHAAGDELLRVIAHRLLAAARESDTVARQGGDEFVVLQRFVRSPQDALRLARRINEALRQPVAINDAVVTISASVGVAIYPDDGNSTEQLVVRADAALYRAKDLGRDCTILYESLSK
jgi:diguanylate cyclase (GGDEF)-like protein/PAS domain S-box-containing protein